MIFLRTFKTGIVSDIFETCYLGMMAFEVVQDSYDDAVNWKFSFIRINSVIGPIDKVIWLVASLPLLS